MSTALTIFIILGCIIMCIPAICLWSVGNEDQRYAANEKLKKEHPEKFDKYGRYINRN